MKMRLCWGRIILARSPDRIRHFLILLMLLLAAAIATAQLPSSGSNELTSLGRALRDKPSPATRAALVRFANNHPRDQAGALALLALGAEAVDSGQYAEAAYHLKKIGKRLPKLEDYVAWWLGLAQFNLTDYPASWATLAEVWSAPAKSPVASRAVIVAARAYTQAGQPRQGLDLLRQHYDRLPQPEGDFALAATFEALGDSVNAAVYHQRVYFSYPLAPQATQSGVALDALRKQLGANYPPELPQAMLGRALQLFEKKQFARAQAEFRALVPRLAGAERDLARVRIGSADYAARRYAAAIQYLKPLELAGEEDAERLRTLSLSARRLNRLEEADAALAELNRKYPQSKWRMEALIAAGDYHHRRNAPQEYEPLYRACFTAFANQPESAHCHWRVAFLAYWKQRRDAVPLLEQHLRQYPGSTHAPAALYFLGRAAERNDDPALARAYFEEVNRLWPRFFYGTMARDRLRAPAIMRVQASAKASEFLKSLRIPQRERTPSFRMEAAAQQRAERAGLLAAAALDDWAERELMFGAEQGEQPHLLAMELAELNTRRGQPDRALRFIKRYAPGYLFYPVEAAPQRFWQFAYPLPFKAELEKWAHQHGVDPFKLAGLIRQESEFNAKAVSRASARGLTQIMPATGRELSRRLRIQPYSTQRLFDPNLNLQLGTFFLKTLLDKWNGRWELALAAYNAGPGRAAEWATWGDFQELAEFVEIIPFAETHDYVQIVLRNAEFYRLLYGSPGSPERAAKPDPAPAVKPTSSSLPR
jgi:soluble lytic murein transglycosylase